MNSPKTLIRPLKQLIVFSLIAFSYSLTAQWTVEIAIVPNYTPENARIFLAGDFNNWNTADDTFELFKNEAGRYAGDFDLEAGEYEYKVTRGDQENEETDSLGRERLKRFVEISTKTRTIIVVSHWQDLQGFTHRGTASDQVALLFEEMKMTQLDRLRRIWIYLPPDYDKTTRSYPVVYLQDGQNLFDKYSSPSGIEWKIDEQMARLPDEEQAIIIGIENGGRHRIAEYSPWVNAEHGGGDGDQYLDFIVNQLKPLVDQNFRSLSDPANSYIGGSSMGALISWYIGTERPDVFGKLMLFSPSFWFAEEALDYERLSLMESKPDIYIVAGTAEDEMITSYLPKAMVALGNARYPMQKLLMEKIPRGQHSEVFWQGQFLHAWKWLRER